MQLIPALLQREMGYTTVEFMSTLPRALHGYTVVLRADGAEVWIPPHTVRISIGAQQERRIASIRIPFVPVTIEFGELEPTLRHQLLTQFDLYFKKGGG